MGNSKIIPGNNRVARFCKASSILEGQPTGASFLLRQNESYLSVNWLEKLGLSTLDKELTSLLSIYNKTFKEGTITARTRTAILHVDKTIEHVSDATEGKTSLIVTHEPSKNTKSHAGIWGYSFAENMIAELIAQSVIPENVHSHM